MSNEPPFSGRSPWVLNEIRQALKTDERLTVKHVRAFAELVADRKNLLKEVERLNEVVYRLQGPM